MCGADMCIVHVHVGWVAADRERGSLCVPTGWHGMRAACPAALFLTPLIFAPPCVVVACGTGFAGEFGFASECGSGWRVWPGCLACAHDP